MQPSLLSIVLAIAAIAIAAVSTLARKVELGMKTVVTVYAACAALFVFAVSWQIVAWSRTKAEVVIKSHSGTLAVDMLSAGKSAEMGTYAFFEIVNLSSKRARMTNFWLEKCGRDGADLPVDEIPPTSLEPSDNMTIAIGLGSVTCKDWFDKGRARLTDGSVVASTKEEHVPPKGNIGFIHGQGAPVSPPTPIGR